MSTEVVVKLIKRHERLPLHAHYNIVEPGEELSETISHTNTSHGQAHSSDLSAQLNQRHQGGSSMSDIGYTMRRVWREQTCKKDRLKLEEELDLVMSCSLESHAAAEADFLVVNTSERKEGKIKFKDVKEIQSGSTPRAIIAEMRKLWKKAGDEERLLADFATRMLRVTMESPGNTWDAAALQRFAVSLPDGVDTQHFHEKHQTFCSLAGRPRGLLVLSEGGRFHLAGVTLSSVTIESLGPDGKLASATAQSLFDYSPTPGWSVWEASPSSFTVHFTSNVGQRNLAVMNVSSGKCRRS
eukprot:1235845-Amphidinium_carterae.1